MWDYTLVNFPFGRVETSGAEVSENLRISSISSPPLSPKSNEPKTVRRGFGEMSLKEDKLWALFEEVKDL